MVAVYPPNSFSEKLWEEQELSWQFILICWNKWTQNVDKISIDFNTTASEILWSLVSTLLWANRAKATRLLALVQHSLLIRLNVSQDSFIRSNLLSTIEVNWEANCSDKQSTRNWPGTELISSLNCFNRVLKDGKNIMGAIFQNKL